MNTKLSAFTLIELLIVITIIAVLASIALPAFTGVKERADQTKDLSNAKQIALALRQFAIDNNGSYPAKAPAADYSERRQRNHLLQTMLSGGSFPPICRARRFLPFPARPIPQRIRITDSMRSVRRRGPIRSNSAKILTPMSLA